MLPGSRLSLQLKLVIKSNARKKVAYRTQQKNIEGCILLIVECFDDSKNETNTQQLKRSVLSPNSATT